MNCCSLVGYLLVSFIVGVARENVPVWMRKIPFFLSVQCETESSQLDSVCARKG